MITIVCKLCGQLLVYNGAQYVTAKWPEGMSYCGTISHPQHVPIAGEPR